MDRMKRRIIEVVRNVVNEHASGRIPTFDEICSGLGLSVIEDDLPIGTEGMYIEKTIFLSSRIRNEERKRFTQFHEITHYLLEENEDLISEFDENILMVKETEIMYKQNTFVTLVQLNF